MIHAEFPENEESRLATLHDLNILYTEADDNYDNITQLASFICKVPVSLITLVGEEKQWFKSKSGTDMCESDRDISFCSHAILKPRELMEVKDARIDPRFKNNPFITADFPIIFYAGMPLLSSNGTALGSLCVIDSKPNSLDENQKEALRVLAKQVENLFELRRQNLHLEKMRLELKSKNSQLKEFAGTVSHDMKMPLANIIITSDILKAKYGKNIDEEGINYLNYLKQSSFKLSNYITGILDHYESDTLTDSLNEDFDIHDLLEQIIDLLNINYDCEINLPAENIIVNSNRSALEQIFLNLLGNSLKYNDKEQIVIDISCESDFNFYYFTISDNGIGIPEDKQTEIFELFKVLAETDRTGNKGNGIGLSTVRKLITSLGGEISVNSEIGKGTTFKFSVKRNDLA
ncbi:GAF domain-containing sensor histidine kinase [Gillisia sp. M10.2A]|uniref:histidine kinase n=1 Tax=Gillisia lutea TaxID=2909668 RepID=A0ABS9EG15_9FLAO|nr:GAF domain-containing sensor histidine kinase [Gillisia lutea]MCF4101743.1 GAF domain-containing sensor histidine kinase [Gillisia lutea]